MKNKTPKSKSNGTLYHCFMCNCNIPLTKGKSKHRKQFPLYERKPDEIFCRSHGITARKYGLRLVREIDFITKVITFYV
jgi:hypothetical protein